MVIYSNFIEKIKMIFSIKIDGVTYKALLKEVPYNFSDENHCFKDCQAPIQHASSCHNLTPNDREELIMEDREIVETKEEDCHPDLSLVSRVSEYLEDIKINEKPHNCQEHSGKETLFWDFPNSADKKMDSINKYWRFQ